jgi:hypothetical protein
MRKGLGMVSSFSRKHTLLCLSGRGGGARIVYIVSVYLGNPGNAVRARPLPAGGALGALRYMQDVHVQDTVLLAFVKWRPHSRVFHTHDPFIPG